MRPKIRMLSILSLFLALFACDDPWQNHLDKFNMDTATNNILEIIQATPELSSFNQLIEEAEVGELISGSITTTVWAPTNAVLENLTMDFDGQPEKLNQFLLNHITRGMYPFSPDREQFRCKMMNGKNVPMDLSEGLIYGKTVSGEFNKVATNGILHIIDQTIDLRPSIWEFLEETEMNLTQIEFLNSLTGEIFVDSLAVQIGFDPVTSEPIYDTLSGTVWNNQFIIEHADLRNEDSIFTFLILDDEVFAEHYNRFAPYYILKSTDKRDSAIFNSYMVCLDLVASGYQTPEGFNGTLSSINGIQVPFERSAIEETIEASNGVIYRISSCDLSLANKFPPIIIEGEDENKVLYTGGGKLGYTRQKALASGGYDFVFDDHDGTPGRIVYQAGMVAATKYKFYWKAVDDFGGAYYGAVPDSLIRQKLEKVIYLPDATKEFRFPVHRSISDSLLYVEDLTYETAEERYAGSYTFTYYEDLWLHLIGSGTNTTLTLDYLKIVPVF